jgi:hypothetical protein
MASLMNGLSALGAGVAQYAGTAGIELQKAQLANQQAILADQLATTRETTLQGQQQTFQTGLQAQQQQFQAGQTQATLAAEAARTAAEQAAANTRNAATIAADLEKTRITTSAMPPDVRDAILYSGAAPGTPEYQKAVRDLAMVKAGVPPDLYGTTPPASGGAATPSGGGSAPSGAAGGSAPPSGSAAGPSPSAAPAAGGAVTGGAPSPSGAAGGTPGSYTPKAPGLDNGAPPGGYNEGVLAGKPQWLVDKVHAMNEGREEPPNPRSMSETKPTPESMAAMLLNQYNPNFDATLYPTRLEAQKAIAPGGSLFTSISAMNTSMGHVDHLGKLYEQLGNYGGGAAINAPLNMIAASTGHYPVINEIKQTVNAMAEEGNRIYAGNAGTQSAIDKWAESFPLNGSIADQQGALKNFAQLMGAKFETLASQVNAAAGYPGKSPVELLTPAAKAIYLREIASDASKGSAPPAVNTSDDRYGLYPMGGAVGGGASTSAAAPARPAAPTPTNVIRYDASGNRITP